jgi:site-specific DNA recombinase
MNRLKKVDKEDVQMKKAVIYARVSSKEQEKEGFSIPAQLAFLKDYARKENMQITQEFIDIETAKKSGRTQFNEMLQYLEKNREVRHILCEKTDRLYRNFKDYVLIEDLDPIIHLVKENEILSRESRSHQKFIHGIKLLMAKNYIDNLSEETKKGMLQKASEGYYPSFAPLGYFNVEKNINGRKIKGISIDKSRYYIIKKMFELYATSNYTLQQIADYASKEGLRSRKGYKIYKSTVHKILKDPIYNGDFSWMGEIYPGRHDAIVSKALYDQVQERFNEHNRPVYSRDRSFVFTGLLKCARCGCAITAEIKKGKYVYYHCTRYKGKCGNPAIREEELIKRLGEVVKRIQVDPKVIDWIREALKLSHKDEKEFHETQIKNLQVQHDKLQNRLEKIYIDKLDETVTDEFYNKMKRQWKKEKEEIFRQIEKHQDANVNYYEKGVEILELSQKLYSAWKRNDHEGKRKILDLLLSNCTLNAGKLYPTYRRPFNMLVKEPSRSNWLPG